MAGTTNSCGGALAARTQAGQLACLKMQLFFNPWFINGSQLSYQFALGGRPVRVHIAFVLCRAAKRKYDEIKCALFGSCYSSVRNDYSTTSLPAVPTVRLE